MKSPNSLMSDSSEVNGSGRLAIPFRTLPRTSLELLWRRFSMVSWFERVGERSIQRTIIGLNKCSHQGEAVYPPKFLAGSRYAGSIILFSGIAAKPAGGLQYIEI